jgi:hypothetical protein
MGKKENRRKWWHLLLSINQLPPYPGCEPDQAFPPTQLSGIGCFVCAVSPVPPVSADGAHVCAVHGIVHAPLLLPLPWRGKQSGRNKITIH